MLVVFASLAIQWLTGEVAAGGRSPAGPARSSCGVEVRCRVPPDAMPACYATLILVSKLPELSLPLRVTVEHREAGS